MWIQVQDGEFVNSDLVVRVYLRPDDQIAALAGYHGGPSDAHTVEVRDEKGYEQIMLLIAQQGWALLLENEFINLNRLSKVVFEKDENGVANVKFMLGGGEIHQIDDEESVYRVKEAMHRG